MTPTTVTDELTHLVIHRAWNQGDLDALDEAVAPDYIRHLSDGRTLRSRDEFKQHVASFRTTVPDIHTEVHHTFTDGHHAALRFTTSGTLANGNHLRFDGAVIVRIENGLLAEEWEFFDTGVRD
ncbi:MAG: ester cyclase [Dehalococcoidia bacterium]